MSAIRRFYLALLWLGVTGSALAVVWSTQETRGLLGELFELRSQANDARILHGQLLLQAHTLAATTELEQVATQSLGLRFATDADIEVLWP
ncbi:MAG: cell division protein FtsL [Cellvibrionales bacterium]|nr:cell division protein FtsL [Cellvibrionales bacterium]